jgi:hypothetical protein
MGNGTIFLCGSVRWGGPSNSFQILRVAVSLFGVLGNDDQFNVALLDVENCMRDIPLGKYALVLSIVEYRPSPTLARNFWGSNGTLTLLLMTEAYDQGALEGPGEVNRPGPQRPPD